MKRRKTVHVRGLVVAVAMLLTACGRESPVVELTPEATTTAVAVNISAPANGAEIRGNVVELDVETRGVEIKPADGDTSGRTGHYHVFIDRTPVAVGQPIPREKGVIHTADDPAIVPGLTIGRHKLTVVLGDGAHNRITDALAEVEVDVKGPSITSTAPAEAQSTTGFMLTHKVEGVELVAADADQGPPGRTGHLHLYIDPRTPPKADGQPIPMDGRHIHTPLTQQTFRRMPPGEHTIWIVLGDKAHVPFDPLVADKVTINVK